VARRGGSYAFAGKDAVQADPTHLPHLPHNHDSSRRTSLFLPALRASGNAPASIVGLNG